LYIVAIQVYISTAVGMAMIMVMSPNHELTSAPAPMVKKWCSHTDKASAETPIIPNTAVA
jgi:hypothetical protein